MNKFVFGFVAALISMSLVSDAYCASRYDEGFRGIAWGTVKQDLPDLGLSKKGLKSIYKSGPSAAIFMEGKGNLDMNLDDIPVLSIFLRFNNMVFYGFDMVFKEEYASKVLSIMEKEMGSKGVEYDGGRRWENQGLVVLVTDRELMVEKKLP
jgi:hypothetical protein